MDLFTIPPIAALLDLGYSGLISLMTLLQPLAGSAAAALAIVVVTLLVRAALIPVGVAQAKAEQTRARLAPALSELQKRHRNDPERLQRETMQLYRDENASPLAGCLPLLIQAPIVGLLYALFLHAKIAGRANELLSHSLFGVPLGSTFTGTLSGGTADAGTWAVFGAIVLLIAIVGEVTRRRLHPATAPSGAGTPALAPVAMGLLGLLQFAAAVIAMFVPLAAGLYLLVTVTWTLVQRLVLRRLYPVTASPSRRAPDEGRT